jgi:DNA polymerase III delta subunit
VTPRVPLACYWGDDSLAVRRAPVALAAELGEAVGEPLEIWVADAEVMKTAPADDADGVPVRGETDRLVFLDQVALRIGMSPLFGSGVLVVVRQPAALLRAAASRERVLGLLERVAPGNGLAFTEVIESRAKETAGFAALRSAIEAAGGSARQFRSPEPGQLTAWVHRRAGEQGMTVEPAAAQYLAECVAGRGEGDVDRRRQTEMLESELAKLALYRPGMPIRREDVTALVTPEIPASAWAFLDAVGTRTAREACRRAEQLLADGMALPVIVTQLHRRIRQLIQVRELVGERRQPLDIAKAIGLFKGGLSRGAEFRVGILTRQAGAWSPDELERALEGLVELDIVSKSLDIEAGGTRSESRGPLALQLWVAEHVPRPGPDVRPDRAAVRRD